MSVTRNFVFGVALALSVAFAAAPRAAFALGSTPVTVVNPSVPVTVGNPDDPAAFAKAQGIQHPFQTVIICSNLGNGCSGSLDLASSNPNQRLIIEFVDAQCSMAPGASLFEVTIRNTGSGVEILHDLAIHDHLGVTLEAGTDHAHNQVPLAQLVRLYADANTTIVVNADAQTSNNSQSFASCALRLSGQAIDP